MIETLPTSNSALAKDARKLLRPLRRDLVDLLRALIRVNTVAVPPTATRRPPSWFCAISYGRRMSVQSSMRRHCSGVSQPLAPERPPLHWTEKPGRPTAGIGPRKEPAAERAHGHGSPGKSQWSTSPWAGNLRKGRVYGLGSFDMKGGLVAQAGVICAMKAAGLRPGGDLIFESVVDEEWGGGGGTLAARLRGDSADACVISEGTQLEIFRATVAVLWLT